MKLNSSTTNPLYRAYQRDGGRLSFSCARDVDNESYSYFINNNIEQYMKPSSSSRFFIGSSTSFSCLEATTPYIHYVNHNSLQILSLNTNAPRHINSIRCRDVGIQFLDWRLVNFKANGHWPKGCSVGNLDWLGSRVH